MNVKVLKDKILQLAIQGKLLPQNENDEPASALIEKIKVEKERLIKEKIIKKEKPLLPITDEEKYFELPKGWEWVRLGDICNFKIGKTPQRSNSEYWTDGKIPWVSISDLVDGKEIIQTKERITEKSQLEIFKGNISKKGTLIMSFKLSIGKVSLLGIDAYHNEAIISIYPYYDYENALKLYLFKILPSLDLTKNTKSAVKGNTLNSESIRNILVPLPPVEEQKRIVKKIDKLFNLIDELENNQQDLLQNISNTRNKVLSLAIQGKLVPQNENDEPASALIEKIKDEKEKLIKEKIIKKEKPLPPITDEEKYFELPKGWEWVRLGEIGLYKKGPFGSTITKSMFVPKSEDTVKVYEQKNAIQKDWRLGEYYVTKEYFESKLKGFEVFEGDIIVSCAGTIGETYIMPSEMEKGVINQALMKMKLFEGINIHYFLMYFDLILKENSKKSSKGSAIKNIPPFDIFKKMLLALPPLEEQKRIVKKVDTIMSYLDTIEKQIKES